MKYKIITLCGSSKFKNEFDKIQIELTLQGNVVLTLPVFSKYDNIHLTQEQIELLNDLHRQKIDMSDEIFVINLNGYIGNNTAEEIKYAESKNKIINYLEEQF